LSNYNLLCTAASKLPHKLPEGQKLQGWALPSIEDQTKPLRQVSLVGEPSRMESPRGSSTPGLWREGHYNLDNKPSLLHQECIRLKDLIFM